MRSDHTVDIAKRRQMFKRKKNTIIGNTMPIHGNAQKLTKTCFFLKQIRKKWKVLHNKKCLTLYLQGRKFLNMMAFSWEILSLHLSDFCIYF